MDEAQYIQLLEEHGIKPTANRILVVKALAASMQPLSLAEIERRIMTIDKSNVFRALSLFREHHLVHAIEGSGDGTRYELCHSHDHDHDEDQHPHCLDYMDMPEVALPPGFELRTVNYLIKGICPHCHR